MILKMRKPVYLNLTFDAENGYVMGTSMRKPQDCWGWSYVPREAVRLPESVGDGSNHGSLFEDGPVSHLYDKYFKGGELEHLKRGDVRIKKKNISNCYSMKLPLPEGSTSIPASEFFKDRLEYTAL